MDRSHATSQTYARAGEHCERREASRAQIGGSELTVHTDGYLHTAKRHPISPLILSRERYGTSSPPPSFDRSHWLLERASTSSDPFSMT